MKRGEIWLASLDPIRGSEQAGTRPVLVVQNDRLGSFLRTTVVVPFTSNLRWSRFPCCLLLPRAATGLDADSVLLGHQIRVLDRTRLTTRIGGISDEALARAEEAIDIAIKG